MPVPGWDESLERAFEKYGTSCLPGRVSCRQKTGFEVMTGSGFVRASLSGALSRSGRIPAVGDFVALSRQPEVGSYTILDILPRRTIFTRGSPGKDGVDQVIAANIDIVFIVTAAGPDLNPRRLERYLALVNASGAKPVILINKADLSGDPSSLVSEIARIAEGIPVIPISALTGSGLSMLDPFLRPAATITLIGSSGVGKSTLINTLLKQAVQETCQVREYDGKGRHRTSVRQLFVLDNGSMIIDNPGLREVGVGTAGSGVHDTFPEIEALAAGCHFSDCRHEHEPGCAVRDAVQKGILPQDRLENYIRLKKELAFAQDKAGIGLTRFERKKWKGISRLARDIRDGKNR